MYRLFKLSAKRSTFKGKRRDHLGKRLQVRKEKKALLPDVETFKEVMVELLKNRSINIPALRKERSENITESTGDISLNELLLDLSDREYEGNVS